VRTNGEGSPTTHQRAIYQRQDVAANSPWQLGPSGHYDGQPRVIRQRNGSAFGSARRTRTAVCCRFLAKIRRVRLQRNPIASSEFRRVLTLAVACRRMFRKRGGGGNCSRVPKSTNYYSGSDLRRRQSPLSASGLHRFGSAQTCHCVAPDVLGSQGKGRENRARRVRFLECGRMGKNGVRCPIRSGLSPRVVLVESRGARSTEATSARRAVAT
jgi:hypothetical protein